MGVHWLSAARVWWSKFFGALSLLAVVPCWLKVSGVTLSSLGANVITAGAAAGLVLLAGVWLFLCGTSVREWLMGFAVAWLGACLVIWLHGQRQPAVACTVSLIPLAGAAYWFSRWKPHRDAAAPAALERLVSTIAATAFAMVLLAATSAPEVPPVTAPETNPRLRDLITQPAILVLLTCGALFTSALALHRWPAALRP